MELFRLQQANHWCGRLVPSYRSPGRYHNKGNPVYTSGTAELAVLEQWRVLESEPIPLRIIQSLSFTMVRIECFLDDCDITYIDPAMLSMNWWRVPSHQAIETQQMGDQWWEECSSLALGVPSAAVQPGSSPETDFNFLLNPRHPEFADFSEDVTYVIEESFDLIGFLSKKDDLE